ncbi:MAG TPA: ComEC/Rec2 family competence protein, partial [Geobacteraceae bacterium]|nr:ComEC/Rec2 family competence protein [Geobacteraceae bacterium]
SFQLSFLVFWGIVVLVPVFMHPFKSVRIGTLTHKLILFFMASAAATAATIIPVAFYFHRTSLTGLISNFLIVPLLGYGAVVIGFSALPFVYLAPPVAKALLLVAAYLVKLSDAIIMFLAKIPLLPLFNPTRLDLLLCCLFLISVTFFKKGRFRLGICVALLLAFSLIRVMHGSPDRGKLALTFFSVGQGESILIDFPDGRHMLVDGGGNPGESVWDVGERLVAPALWKMGIGRLDYMVLTHPHPDHCKGLNYIAANFVIGEFWEGGSYPECTEYRELMKVIRQQKIPVRRVNSASAALAIGGTEIRILAPFPGNNEKTPVDYLDMNDESVVFRVGLRRFSALLTGDAGAAIEDRLLLHPELLHSTILKVPHHGSRFSSTVPFLTAVAPRIAVISAGFRNSFHLPAQETLDKLSKMGIITYRTDLDGAVRVVCDPRRIDDVTVTTSGHFH